MKQDGKQQGKKESRCDEKYSDIEVYFELCANPIQFNSIQILLFVSKWYT